MRVEVSPQAQQDLTEIADYIARDDPVAAERWVAALEGAARAAGDNPRIGRVVPELRKETVREVLVGDYRVVYLIELRRVLVLTVFHGSRQLRRRNVTRARGAPTRRR